MGHARHPRDGVATESPWDKITRSIVTRHCEKCEGSKTEGLVYFSSFFHFLLFFSNTLTRSLCHWFLLPGISAIGYQLSFIHHLDLAWYCAIPLSCSHFAIGWPWSHVTSSVCIYISPGTWAYLLYLCYLRISCPFPVLHDWVDKWLRNSFSSLLFSSLLSLSISLYQYISFLSIHPQHEIIEGNSFGATPLGANSLLSILTYPLQS